MKKSYVRPEWNCEEFALSQHIALGCTEIKIEVVPGSSVVSDWVGCTQVKSGTESGGKGHWAKSGVEIFDDNGNGLIDWAEIVKYVGTAINGTVTGGGHQGHDLVVELPNREVEVGTPLNS